MKYGIAESIADFGFHFFEKLHEPIFLVSRSGKAVRMNEAGRKFLRVIRRSPAELEIYVRSSMVDLFQLLGDHCRRKYIGKRLHIVARSFSGTDLVLIEVLR